jgi:hypothetical protein
LLSASNNTKRNETVAVALFSTFNRPLSLRLGQFSSLYIRFILKFYKNLFSYNSDRYR